MPSVARVQRLPDTIENPMDLHVIKKSAATPDVLVRAVKRAQAILARLIATETYLEGATAFTSAERSLLASANHAADLRLPPGVNAAKVLDTIDAHFAAASVRCAALDASELDWPADFQAAIESRGWRAVRRNVYLLSDYVPPVANAAVQVIPGRAAYGELRQALTDRATRVHNDAARVTQQVEAAMDQLDDSRIDIFLARQSRKPVGVASLLTLGNIGVVLDLVDLSANDSSAVFHTLAARLFDHCCGLSLSRFFCVWMKAMPSCRDWQRWNSRRWRVMCVTFEPIRNIDFFR